MSNKRAFSKGMYDSIPIALAYFAVAFSLGIMARKAGLTPFQGFLSSMLNHASAGEYAEFTVIEAGAPYIEMALVILITNARYLLMSCALSQRFAPDAPLIHRVLVGFGITDEIFGISIARPGNVNPFYTYGAMALALPAWSSATAIGIVAGNILPASAVSALSIQWPVYMDSSYKNFVCKYENYNLDNCNRRSSRSIVSSEGRNAGRR